MRRFGKQETKLASDVVVSSLAASDGSLWFGAFNGGLTRYAGGSFRVYNTRNSALANNSVWSLAEDMNGDIVIGSLGGGVQIMNPRTGHFTTYNTDNSRLPSKYVMTVVLDSKGNIIVGHSMGLSVIYPRRRIVNQLPATVDGNYFSSSAVNDVFVDSRGLAWNANMSGLDVYNQALRPRFAQCAY